MRIDAAIIERIANEARSIDPEDDQFVIDHIEGETDALEIASKLISRDADLRCMIAANKERIKQLRERTRRLEAASASCRRACQMLLSAMGVRKLERPEATLSIRALPSSVIDGPIEALPPHLTRTKVEPDRVAIKNALEAGEPIEGWALSNGGETISMRFK